MFTGLVEEIGVIKSVSKTTKSARITIKALEVLHGLKIGDSISTNGVCLTVTEYSTTSFSVDVMAETMRYSSLDFAQNGTNVNLERALRLGDRLGGHIVSGHVDGLGTIFQIEQEENATWLSIKASSSLLHYIIHKGSVAIDGVSLTVAYVDDYSFKVSIIPHTKDMTTLHSKRIGDVVNIECDMMGKYIEKFITHKIDKTEMNTIDENFLREHGFM